MIVSVVHVGVGVMSFELVWISVAVTERVSVLYTVVITVFALHSMGTSVDSV